jgi:NAD(P)-dependent dehydrogenase (short-subunit alcohol dehydrogenase family)
MKILIVGASGDVGQAVIPALRDSHEIITAGRKSGDIQVDMTKPKSVQHLYRQVGKIDAVVAAAGVVRFKPLLEHTTTSMLFGLRRKLMGQINLVLHGLEAISDNGSFTLTSGILECHPVVKGLGAATANGALRGFVKSAAVEMPRGVRINAVSPGLLDVSEKQYGHMFPGHAPVSSKRVGRAYVKSIEGAMTGEVLLVF